MHVRFRNKTIDTYVIVNVPLSDGVKLVGGINISSNEGMPSVASFDSSAVLPLPAVATVDPVSTHYPQKTPKLAPS
jgi:hypothetical protein